MSYPRILYLNRTIDASAITASAETTGYPDDFMLDWKPYRRWYGSGATNSYTVIVDLGSALSVTALALCGHNLNTVGARYKLEAGTDGIAFGTSVVAYQTPDDDKTVAHFFTDVSKRYYRLTIDNNGGANFTPQLGVLFLGDYIEFEDYIDAPFDPDTREPHGTMDYGETGNILGQTTDFIGRPIEASLPWVTSSWYVNTWLPYYDSYHNKPFIMVWDPDNHADQAFLCAWDMKRMTAPYNVSAYRGPLKLTMFNKVET